jgi:hypothetical protein
MSANAIAICCAAWMGLTMYAAAAVDFPESSARRGCSQEDAPALEIYLTREPFEKRGEPAPPYIRFEIAGREHTTLIGKSIELAPLSRAGRDPASPLARGEFNDASTHQWLRGTVTLRRLEADRLVEGVYDVKGTGDLAWVGTFSARWIAPGGGCG